MSNYSAVVAPLENVRPHPNADRLQLADAVNEQVIIGLEHHEGELGVFVPAGTVLAKDFLIENRLYRKHPDTDEPMGGYFEGNRRVRFLKLRKEMSRGIWLPLTCLDYICLEKYPVQGQEFQELDGHEIVQKYIVPSPRQAQPGKPRSKVYENFYEIGETPKLVLNLHRLAKGDYLVFTEKLHGTSGRTAYLPLIEKEEKRWLKRQLDKVILKLGYFKQRAYQFVTGTRRMVLGENSPDDNNYRLQIHDKIKPHLRRGMIVYYEIVGDGIMQIHTPHGIEDGQTKKEVQRLYGEEIHYTYSVPSGMYDFYIYKIVEHNPDGFAYVYSWDQLVDWCKLHGLKHVPVLKIGLHDYNHVHDKPAQYEHSPYANVTDEQYHQDKLYYYKINKQVFMDEVKKLCDGPSSLDKRHPKEGIVLQTKYGPFKHKSDVFCILEDIRPYEEPEIEIIEE